MNKYTSIFAALTIAISLTACGDDASSTPRTAVTTTPSELAQIYSANKFAGKAKFDGHTIQISATLKDVDTVFGDPVLDFSNGTMLGMGQLIAFINDGQEANLAKLHPGDTVTLLCQSVNGDDGESLKDCDITSYVHN